MAVGGSTAYNQVTSLPRLVSEAVGLAGSMHFDNSCAPEQGRLLSVLAAGRSGARIGETGTGCGVGLEWMIEATDPSTSFVSIEIDAARATAAADLYRDFPNVHVVEGSWQKLIDHAPFDLLVLDGGGKGKDRASTRRSTSATAGSRSGAWWSWTTSPRLASQALNSTIPLASTG